MFVKVEPSGCCERKGLCQIRFSMYLDPGDVGYEKRYIQVPVVPPEGYQGKVDAKRAALDGDDYNAWVKGLPKMWQNTPFHDHFIYVEPDTTDDEIMDIGKAFLKKAYPYWVSGKFPDLKNEPVVLPVRTKSRINACITKIQHVKEIPLVRVV